MNLNVNSVNHFIGVLMTNNECLKMSESYSQNIDYNLKVTDVCDRYEVTKIIILINMYRLHYLM